MMTPRPLSDSNWRELLLWLLRRRRRFRVTEKSMQPTLQPGEEVLVDPRAYRDGGPAVGDLVVAFHPLRQDFKLIKRVRGVEGNGRVFLQGDNASASTDSRQFGPIEPDQIVGKVTSKFG